jgi:hypothetical protein
LALSDLASSGTIAAATVIAAEAFIVSVAPGDTDGTMETLVLSAHCAGCWSLFTIMGMVAFPRRRLRDHLVNAAPCARNLSHEVEKSCQGESDVAAGVSSTTLEPESSGASSMLF